MNQGERVVRGQRMMQAASDIFLGWTRGIDDGYHYYWRQLRDMKGAIELDLMAPEDYAIYGGLCGWTLARAHARSGDPIAIAEYLGSSGSFDRAIVEFSKRYADQNQRDYEAFCTADRAGTSVLTEGV